MQQCTHALSGAAHATHYNKFNLTATNEAMNKYTTQSKAETTKLLFFSILLAPVVGVSRIHDGSEMSGGSELYSSYFKRLFNFFDWYLSEPPL